MQWPEGIQLLVLEHTQLVVKRSDVPISARRSIKKSREDVSCRRPLGDLTKAVTRFRVH